MSLLTRPRVMIVASLLAALNLCAVLFIWAGSTGGVDYDGRPVGTDFIAFWSAGWLALDGQIAAGNGNLPFSLIHPLAPAGQEQVLLWTYPPPFLLLVAPLALLAYLPAVLSFVGASLATALAACRALTAEKLALLLLLGAPATLMCVLTGQTGLLVAAALGGGLALRNKNPWLAGLILSAAIIKPHFLFFVPLFLLLQRDIKTLAALAVGCSLWIAGSIAVFGPEPWRFFIDMLPQAQLILQNGTAAWEKMGSAFVSAKLLGASTSLAWDIHIFASLLALALAYKPLQRRDTLAPLALILLTLIMVPYQFDYDLVLLLPALAFWQQSGKQTPAEELVMILLYLAGVLFPALTVATHFGTLPALLLAALALVHKRHQAAAPA